MDTITHALTGAVVAKAIDDEKIGKWRLIAGIAMGLFPDSDFVLGLINRQFFLQYHRDFTHSLLLVPFYSLFFSWIFVKISKRPYFWSFYKICLLVLISHVLGDLLTSYGTMILSPFDDRRFSWDLVFIIDPVISGLVLSSLAASIFWKNKARWICRCSLIGLTLYILFCWVQHHRAIELTRTFAKDINEEIIQVASLPQPVSPFRWANLIETKDKVYQGFVDLHLKELPIPVNRNVESGDNFFLLLKKLKGLYEAPGKVNYRSYKKLQDSPWVEKALATDGVKFYYWFARFPVVRSVNSEKGRHRVEFMDIRFIIPEIRSPFVYYVEFDNAGKVQAEGFEEDGNHR